MRRLVVASSRGNACFNSVFSIVPSVDQICSGVTSEILNAGLDEAVAEEFGEGSEGLAEVAGKNRKCRFD